MNQCKKILNQFRIFLLFYLYYDVLAFTKSFGVTNRASPLRHHICNVNMIDNRRNFMKMPLSIVPLSCLPHIARANEPDSSWTQHKGAFTEDEIKDFIKTDTGLLYKDVAVGQGALPNDGDVVTIHMVGYIFETGDKWSNTYKGIPSYQSSVRAGPRENQKIMKGLNEGVKTMKRGGKRILVIPPYLAYSYITIFSDQNPNVEIIPGGATLVCYVEVLDFKPLK